MEKFIIEVRNNEQYIVSAEHGFTLKVISPEKRAGHHYTPGKEVGAIFEEDFEYSPNFWDYGSLADYHEAEQRFHAIHEAKRYDFEGIDILFFDNDRQACNKEQWWDAIEYYGEHSLGKTLAALNAYGYEYDYSVKNNTTEMMMLLNGKTAPNYN